jgi:hypothetical protein
MVGAGVAQMVFSIDDNDGIDIGIATALRDDDGELIDIKSDRRPATTRDSTPIQNTGYQTSPSIDRPPFYQSPSIAGSLLVRIMIWVHPGTDT